MSTTKLRKEQIRINEFIQPTLSADWTSDTLSASAAAIAAKIAEAISGVSGGLTYRGAWSLAATDTILKGYEYVYDGNGTMPTGVTLEIGDTLIAKQDNANPSNANHWTIIQMTSGNVTDANLVTKLLSALVAGNSNSLTIAAGATGTANEGKLVLTVNYPTVSGGSEESGKYVKSVAINSSTGVITVAKGNLPSSDSTTNILKHIVLDEEMTLSSGVYYTAHPLLDTTRFTVYLNGLPQEDGSDVELVKVSSGTYSGKGSAVFNSLVYTPDQYDRVTATYVSTEVVS